MILYSYSFTQVFSTTVQVCIYSNIYVSVSDIFLILINNTFDIT